MHQISRAGRTQRGNILFLILLAVVLFAALSYAVTQGMRGGGKDGGSESANLKAAQIIQYATLLEQTITRLRLINNCSDSQISFHFDSDGDGILEPNNQDAYYNPNSPINYKCHVFHTNGGQLTRFDVPDEWLDSAISLDDLGGHGGINSNGIAFNAGSCVVNVGTTVSTSSCAGSDNELIFMIPRLKDDICAEINYVAQNWERTKRFSTSLFPSTNVQLEGLAFVGAYPASPHTEINIAELYGKTSFCLRDNSGWQAGNVFNHVLIAR